MKHPILLAAVGGGIIGVVVALARPAPRPAAVSPPVAPATPTTPMPVTPLATPATPAVDAGTSDPAHPVAAPPVDALQPDTSVIDARLVGPTGSTEDAMPIHPSDTPLSVHRKPVRAPADTHRNGSAKFDPNAVGGDQ
jgi:hypothetical protein